MKGPTLGVLLALLCFMAGASHSALDYATGPGTVQYALARPDGVRVSITMVVIARVGDTGILVHEWWNKPNPIPVLLKPAGLKVGQTIDIEGRMTTLPSGRRAVLCEQIALYLDRFGHTVESVPPLKGLLDPSVWPTRGWIEVRQASASSTLSEPGMTVLEDPQPPPVGEPPPAYGMTLPDHSIAKAKSVANGNSLSESITGKIVTAGTNQITGCIYVEEPDRSCGIRVVTGGTFAVGDRVDVTAGTMATTVDGERYINTATVSLVDHPGELQPLGLIGRNIGGTAFADGANVYQAGVLGGFGLNNIGLLVKTWGKVTYKDADYVYIDDGTAPSDGSGHVGLRVERPGSGVLLPAVGTTAEFTGISSCATVNSNIVRVLRLRKQDDAPVVMHVKPTGNDGNDGSTWALAKLTVQDAINDATVDMEIWVAAGTYNEHITLAAGKPLYGGFLGNEIRRDGRNVLGNPTILDGGGSGWVVSSGSSTVIDGFTISHGVRGIYCTGFSATISNNTITGNTDAGVYCYSSSPTISHNTVMDNTGSTGGIYCTYYAAPTISGNNISTNPAGGIRCYDSSSPTITNNIMSGNAGPAIRCSYYSSPVITNNTITASGSAIDCGSSSWPEISNNVVAFNTVGINGYPGYPTLSHNCVYGNSSYDYYGLSAGTGDISADPSFVDPAQGHLHIQPISPCIDAGSNQAPGIPLTDMDGQPRIQNDIVDIGADESDGCGWYCVTLSADPEYAPIGETITVTANIKDWNQQVIEGVTVCLTASEGAITEINGNPLPPGTTSGCGQTDASGNATVVVTQETPGWVTVTVQVGNSCETGETTEAIRVRFYDPLDPLVEAFFCVDCTESMWGTGYDHGAQASVKAFLTEMSTTYGIEFRVGGIKFNNPYSGSGTDSFEKDSFGDLTARVFTSLGAFQSLGSMGNWIDNGYRPHGGDTAELQLDALHYAAQDMNAHAASSHKYIVLITDSPYHDGSGGSTMSLSQVVSELTATGCPVYISLWNDAFHNDYTQFIVNGGEFDPSNSSGTDQSGDWKYPLVQLRARILADTGN